MRDVLDRLEVLGLRWYITGSEAGACYGVLRQTFDTDIVLDLAPGQFPPIAGAFEAGHIVAAEIDYGTFSMASVIDRLSMQKVDLILRRPTPWTESTMSRRARVEHPSMGCVSTAIGSMMAISTGGHRCSAWMARWPGSVMRPDHGHDLQEAMIADSTLERRVGIMRELREQGVTMAWHQADAAGPMTEVERAMFLIDRLYPEMPRAHRAQFRDQFQAQWDAGTWHGSQRPAPLRPHNGL